LIGGRGTYSGSTINFLSNDDTPQLAAESVILEDLARALIIYGGINADAFKPPPLSLNRRIIMKMKTAAKQCAVIMMIAALPLLVLSCDKNKTNAADDGRIVLNYTTYRVGTHLSAPLERAVIKRFNENYGKDIRLNIEELPSDSAYNDKMKVLAVSGGLPDIIDGKDGLRDLVVQSGKALELSPYINADPEF
jgi:hypothetical protein